MTNLWTPNTNGNDEWLQVDLAFSETITQVSFVVAIVTANFTLTLIIVFCLQVTLVARQTPDFDRFRSIEVRVGDTRIVGGTQVLSGINTLCATIPDVVTDTTVYEMACSPGPVKGNLSIH